MPDVAWNSSVLRTGTLTIDASAVHGAWVAAITAAIRELNTVLASNNVNVTLAAGSSAVVIVALTSGAYTFQAAGNAVSGTLRTDILHGATRSVDMQYGSKISRDQAYIFLPQSPRVNPKDKSSRVVGEPIMRVMIAHEFLHALGLDKHDPAFVGLFSESWTVNAGGRPASDTVSPFGGTAKLPPLTLSGDTVSRLNALWP